MCIKDGNLLVVDWISKSILEIDKNLNFIRNKVKIELPDPAGLACSRNALWLTDSTLSLIMSLDTKGNKLFYKATAGHLHGISFLNNDELLIIERNAKKLLKVSI